MPFQCWEKTGILAKGFGLYEMPPERSVRSAQFEIQEFGSNAVIPHQRHFKFLPKPLVRPVVSGF